jgi:pyruvate kinase
MQKHKLTKIVATISDRRCDVDFIRQLFEAGMNVARINTAHAEFDATRQMIANIRSVSKSIAILIDTKGPEIRTGYMEGDAIEIPDGHVMRISMEECLGNKLLIITDNYVSQSSKEGRDLH